QAVDRGLAPSLILDQIIPIPAEERTGALALAEIPADVVGFVDELGCSSDRNRSPSFKLSNRLFAIAFAGDAEKLRGRRDRSRHNRSFVRSWSLLCLEASLRDGNDFTYRVFHFPSGRSDNERQSVRKPGNGVVWVEISHALDSFLSRDAFADEHVRKGPGG